MKKTILSILTAATMLFTTGCSEDDALVQSDQQNATFQIELEGVGEGSRKLPDGTVIGMGSKVDKVYYAVYETGKDKLLKYGDATVANKAASVVIPLVNGLKFDIVFFAHNEAASAFTIPGDGDLRNITFKTSLKANQETYDAFYHVEKGFRTASNTTTPVTLKRPLAQLNVATTAEDLADAEALKATVTKSKIVLKGVPTVFNARTGVASDPENITQEVEVVFDSSPILTNSEGKNETLTCKIGGADKTFHYLAMAYVLANEKSALYDSKFEFSRADGSVVSQRSIPNLPLQRNYRTNITGSILTQKENFTISLDTNFGTDSEHNVDANDITVSDVADLNAALAELAKVEKELILNVKGLKDYTYSGDNDNIVIPAATSENPVKATKITLNLLDVNKYYKVVGAEFDKTVVVATDLGVTIDNAEIIIPNSHVKVIGNYTNLTISSSSTTLEVAEGSSIGTLTVMSGNVAILNGGVVENIERHSENNETTTIVTVEPGGVLTNKPTGTGIKVDTTPTTEDGVWVLSEDIELNVPITIEANEELTIDLNGYTLSQEKECTASYSMIENKGTLTIKDTKGTGKISFNDTSAGDSSFGWGSYTIRNEGTLVVESGIIEHLGKQDFATHMICAIFQYSGSTTINGGTISTPNYRSVRLWKGDMTINDGTFDGQLWVQSVDDSAELTINGGNFGPNGRDGSSVFVTNDKYNVKFAVTGGTFETKIGCSDATKLAGCITGGTFTEAAKDATNEALLADKCSFEENEDGTFDVVEGDYLSLGEFVEAVIAAEGSYDGQGALVKIVPVSGQTDNSNGCKVPDRLQSYSNPEVYYAQFQRFSELTDVSISNVNFEFVPAAVTVTDAWNTAGATTTAENINGELQFMNTGSVTLTNCTFNMVAVSPIYASTLVVEGCTFKNLMAYAIKDIKAGEVSINENSFENCNGGFWFNAAPSNLEVEGNTFSEVGRRGAIQFSASGDYSETVMDISNNTVEGDGAFLWQLNSTITADQIIAILDNNTFETAFVDGSVTPGILTPDNYVTTTLKSNENYTLYGDFGSNNVSLVMANGVENVVFEGSKATNINELIITQNGALIDNANTPIGERSGNVTVQNFNVLSQINVFACKTEVVVQKNTAEALMIYAGNCDVKVLNNTIDANFESHPTYRDENNTWNTNNYGIALNIFDYNLWLDGNTVTDATGHAIGINGWEGTIDNGDANVIESFKNNKITVNSTTNTKRAAFKVWDDETYASNDDDTDVVNATAQAFINAVLADGSNTFNIIEGYDHTIFCFYNVNTNN